MWSYFKEGVESTQQKLNSIKDQWNGFGFDKMIFAFCQREGTNPQFIENPQVKLNLWRGLWTPECSLLSGKHKGSTYVYFFCWQPQSLKRNQNCQHIENTNYEREKSNWEYQIQRKMLRQDLKKIGLLTAGLGAVGAAIYNSRYRICKSRQSESVPSMCSGHAN